MNELDQRQRTGKHETARIPIPAKARQVSITIRLPLVEKRSTNDCAVHVWIVRDGEKIYYGGQTWKGSPTPVVGKFGEVDSHPKLTVGPLDQFASKAELYVKIQSLPLTYGVDVEFSDQDPGIHAPPDEHHSISYVGSFGFAQTTNGSSLTTPSRTTAAGNSILGVLASWNSSGTSATFSDNKSGSYTAAQNPSGGGSRAHIGYDHNTAGGAGHTVTANFSGGSWGRINALEYSGMSDEAAEATNSGKSSGTSAATGSATASSGAVTVAVVTHDSEATISPTGAGWTERIEQENASGGQPINATDKTSAGASEQGTWTLGSSVGWACVIASFKLAGGSTFEESFSLSSVAELAKSPAVVFEPSISFPASSDIGETNNATLESQTALAALGAITSAPSVVIDVSAALNAEALIAQAGGLAFEASISLGTGADLTLARDLKIEQALSLAAVAADQYAAVVTFSPAATLALSAGLSTSTLQVHEAAASLETSAAVTIDGAAIRDAALTLQTAAGIAVADDLIPGGGDIFEEALSLAASAGDEYARTVDVQAASAFIVQAAVIANRNLDAVAAAQLTANASLLNTAQVAFETALTLQTLAAHGISATAILTGQVSLSTIASILASEFDGPAKTIRFLLAVARVQRIPVDLSRVGRFSLGLEPRPDLSLDTKQTALFSLEVPRLLTFRLQR